MPNGVTVPDDYLKDMKEIIERLIQENLKLKKIIKEYKEQIEKLESK